MVPKKGFLFFGSLMLLGLMLIHIGMQYINFARTEVLAVFSLISAARGSSVSTPAMHPAM